MFYIIYTSGHGVRCQRDWKSVSVWLQVLEYVGLPPLTTDRSEASKRASRFEAGGEIHEKKPAERARGHAPAIVELPPSTPDGEVDVALPSADCLDVSSRLLSERVAVEIRPQISLFRQARPREAMDSLKAAFAGNTATPGEYWNAAPLPPPDACPAAFDIRKQVV